MRALVTGGTGFLGKKLAYRLKNMGFEVTILGRNKTIGNKMKEEGFIFIESDLSHNKTIDACKNQDYVFHSGALSSPWGKYNDFFQSNVIGTKNVIEGCKLYKVKRLIHVSTPSIYFDYTDKFLVKESDTLPSSFVNDYAKTKYMAEELIDNAFKEGLNVITIRPRALFGPNDNAIIPRLIKANERGVVPIIDGGRSIIDITYVENVVDALILCMNSPSSTLGEKYNITNDEHVIFVELLEKVFNKLDMKLNGKNISFKFAYNAANVLELISRTILFGKEPLFTKYTAGVLAKSQTLDISKAKNELNYKPNISVDEGINLFIDWWSHNNES